MGKSLFTVYINTMYTCSTSKLHPIMLIESSFSSTKTQIHLMMNHMATTLHTVGSPWTLNLLPKRPDRVACRFWKKIGNDIVDHILTSSSDWSCKAQRLRSVRVYLPVEKAGSAVPYSYRVYMVHRHRAMLREHSISGNRIPQTVHRAHEEIWLQDSPPQQ